MDVRIVYVALVLAIKLVKTSGNQEGICNNVHSGTTTIVENKVLVPGVGLPAGKKNLRARIPIDICGDNHELVGISVLACDLVPGEEPHVQVEDLYWARVQRQGYSWLSEPGSLIIFASCAKTIQVIEFPGNDWRRYSAFKNG